ncbi:hypothetical protein KHA80_15885 [Anaerobacillus sp. HL2]|nr:hypothetical protein KHA80_15885 [Anaerobacillus sp. HL2]
MMTHMHFDHASGIAKGKAKSSFQLFEKCYL